MSRSSAAHHLVLGQLHQACQQEAQPASTCTERSASSYSMARQRTATRPSSGAQASHSSLVADKVQASQVARSSQSEPATSPRRDYKCEACATIAKETVCPSHSAICRGGRCPCCGIRSAGAWRPSSSAPSLIATGSERDGIWRRGDSSVLVYIRGSVDDGMLYVFRSDGSLLSVSARKSCQTPMKLLQFSSRFSGSVVGLGLT